MDGLWRFFGVPAQDAAEQALRRADFCEGFGLLVAAMPAILIWGLVTAVAMVGAGLSPTYVVLINLTVYAGSAQLAVLSMLAAGAGGVPIPLIWLTALVVNLRFVIFSASIKPFFRHLPLRWRLLYGYLNGDVPMVLFQNHYRNQGRQSANVRQSTVFLGLAASNFIAWQVGTLAGVLLAALVPTDWGLSLAAALTLFILIVKMVDNWAGVAGCTAAALTAVGLHGLPDKLWVVCAIAVGVVVAVVVERLTEGESAPPHPNLESVEDM